jgi:glycosyltransferase involved in cell wall biosynthesis
MNRRLPAYVLITPARNEAAFIEGTIQSVIAQTVLPARWVIVSDGSTDETDSIVARYAAGRPWIELVRMPERQQRHFAGKAHAFKAGCDRLADLDYEIIGNLDADVTFSADYFDFLLRKFTENPRLGVAGTPFREGEFQYDFRYTNIEHVSGQIQMFRKECYEAIGGYRPIKTGGIDLVAVMTARMKGWQTRTFLEKQYNHHRKMGSAKHGWLTGEFNGGRVDYILGCHPVWQLLRSIRRLKSQHPVVLSGILCLAGYLWAMAKREVKVIPEDLVRFRRAEEVRRIGEIFRNFLPRRQPATGIDAPSVEESRSHSVGR